MAEDLLNNPNLEVISLAGRKIYLLGTAHISEASVALVTEAISALKPDAVAIELCQHRFQSLKDPQRWKDTDIVEVIRSKRSHLLLLQLLLASFQKKLGDKLKVKPGAEMMQAAALATDLDIPIVLADRDIKLTLKRAWGGLGYFSLAKLFFGALLGSAVKQEVDKELIEKLKNSDYLEALMQDFSRALPELRKTLIDERDQYLAAKIGSARGEVVLAVVGAGHVAGIKRLLAKEDFADHIDLSSLEEVPKKGFVARVLPWLIPAVVLCLIAYGFVFSEADTGLLMLQHWVLINAFCAALGAVCALAHPLTIVSAALISPLSSLHPFFAAGWGAGLVEALLRKPKVTDFEKVVDDLATFKGWWRNRISRILLVVVFTNLLGTLGTFWAWWALANLV